MSAYTDVVAWHHAAGVPVAEHLTPLAPDRLALRLALLREEYLELVEALEAGDVAGAAKESADLITVALGTDAEQGIDSDMVWAAVHASNVAKLGLDGAVRRRADGKILKPEGWQPPDIAAVLAAATQHAVCYRIDPDNATCEPDNCGCLAATPQDGGHILRVHAERDSVWFAVDCHESADAPCRFATGCLVTEQCTYSTQMWAEYYDRTTPLPLHDGMPIKVEWSVGDECWMWAPC